MVRPLRIEFEGAWYHVMNRGAGYRSIFKTNRQREYFLSLLDAVTQRFNADVHAYCLMGNHYHLMIRTPDGNLQRIMRHINGVYTQYFNRTQKTDGPLFRGRYKAILVEAETYWLELSRYIHRNPIDILKGKSLETYRWSSYPAYVGEADSPEWLTTQYILNAIGKRNQQSRYQLFVKSGVSDELTTFYGGSGVSSILGGAAFKTDYIREVKQNPEVAELKQYRKIPSMERILSIVCRHFEISKKELLKSRRGRHPYQQARAMAMYLCQEYGEYTLADIAEKFNLAGYASAGATIRNYRERKKESDSINLLNLIMQDLTSQQFMPLMQ
ncbi:DnaA-like protein [Pleionea mediterranea]|uniref:DnaA-like protein n=1 Tax=Pleionea mediterranea TaxID=523701 RepID=A0A316FIG8_9GAMM|nr:DnaA-like protein [Pleionea mediterranea]